MSISSSSQQRNFFMSPSGPMRDILQSIQHLSKETEIDHLYKSFIELVGLNYGADRVILLLAQEDDLKLKVEWDLMLRDNLPVIYQPPLQSVLYHHKSQQDEVVLVKIVQHVFKTSESLSIHDLGRSDFASHPYVAKWGTQTVFSIPVIRKSRVLAILYLENRKMVNVFSHNRVSSLSALCSQLAILICNAETLAEAKLRASIKDEQLRNEQTLRQKSEKSERRYKRIIENVPHLVFTTGSRGEFKFVNTKFKEYTTLLNVEEIYVLGWTCIVHEHDWIQFQEHWNQALRTGKEFNAEIRFKKGDKDHCWHLVRAVPLKKNNSEKGVNSIEKNDPDGKLESAKNIVEWFGTCTDIDDKKMAEAEQLRRIEAETSEKKYRLLAEAISSIVLTATPDCWVDFFNERFYNYTGISRRDTTSIVLNNSSNSLPRVDTWIKAIHQADRDMLIEKWKKAVATSSQVEIELRLIRADGEARFHLLKLLPVTDQEGKILKWIGTFVEIEDQRKSLQQQAKAKEVAEEGVKIKSHFLSNISHKIRTPMNGILGMLNILLESGLSEEQRGNALSVQKCADGLLSIINDVLNYNEMESGKLELFASAFNVEQIMEAVGELMSSLAQEKGLGLYFDVDEKIPIRVIGDPEKLHQILLNLVGNAIKFTEKGEIIVSCSLITEKDENLGESENSNYNAVNLLFEVKDTGCGIPEDQLNNLFTPFYQVRGNQRENGAGLGLAICNQLAHVMNSSINVESIVGVGSTFSFKVNVQISYQTQETANSVLHINPIPIANFDPEFLNNIRVLVVSASEACQRVVCTQLSSLGLPSDYLNATKEDVLGVLRSIRTDNPLVALVGDSSAWDLLVELFSTSSNLYAENRTEMEDKLSAIIMLDGVYPSRQPELGSTIPVHYVLQPTTRSKLCSVFHQLSKSFVNQQRNASPGSENPTVPLTQSPTIQEELSAAKFEVPQKIVLVVEDNHVNMKVIVRHLAKLDLQCVTASDGIQAVEAFSSRPRNFFSLILMDCGLPRMDGFEATVEIRKLEKGQTRIPIVALTANVVPGITEQCANEGMDHYLPKPVNFKALNTIIQNILTSREERQM
eukprot:TRINITY_DN4037_c0_g1_i3.p1 TRINITY_DN4037_c0_g1~~TRINITY_DN4037_c0_g1_i3.p1  ORF type:complete len:1087 (-),score=230.37 TRINITY_DN4037_c0_g1_i3:90-3350(-)